MKQIAVQVRNSSNVAVTGLVTADFSVRVSPYGGGNAISGLTATEIGVQGNYVISGFTAWYQNIKVYVSGVEQTWIGVQDVGDLTTAFLLLAGGTMGGNIAMGGFKITGAGAATTNGDLVRYEQAVRTTGAQTGLSGIKVWSDLQYYSPSDIIITGDGAFTSKKYVDDLFGGVVGVVQSTYLNKLIPLRATEDSYSHTTPELCYAYLNGLTDIATRTGTVLIEPSGLAGNIVDVDNHATNQWIGNGIFYQGIGKKPIINRKGYNSSLTITGGIINCRILDNNVVSARTYVNWIFENCDFDVPDATDINFTGCTFKGVNNFKSDGGGTLSMSNCLGDFFFYNDSLTPTITGTQPQDVRAKLAANFDY